MDDRFRTYIQKERVAAIDEFAAAFRTYMVDTRQVVSGPMWDQYAAECREMMVNGGRDPRRDRQEPIIRQCTCAHVNAKTGKKCPRSAVLGAYCRPHGKNRTQLEAP